MRVSVAITKSIFRFPSCPTSVVPCRGIRGSVSRNTSRIEAADCHESVTCIFKGATTRTVHVKINWNTVALSYLLPVSHPSWYHFMPIALSISLNISLIFYYLARIIYLFQVGNGQLFTLWCLQVHKMTRKGTGWRIGVDTDKLRGIDITKGLPSAVLRGNPASSIVSCNNHLDNLLSLLG